MLHTTNGDLAQIDDWADFVLLLLHDATGHQVAVHRISEVEGENNSLRQEASKVLPPANLSRDNLDFLTDNHLHKCSDKCRSHALRKRLRTNPQHWFAESSEPI